MRVAARKASEHDKKAAVGSDHPGLGKRRRETASDDVRQFTAGGSHPGKQGQAERFSHCPVFLSCRVGEMQLNS